MGGCGGPPADGPGRPWEIERLADGGTRVMGLRPGESTMGDALALFGRKVEAGLFQDEAGDLALESYFSSVNLRGVTGRLILGLEVAPGRLEEMRAAATETERLRTGTLRHRLPAALSEELLDAPITTLTFVPSTDLEEAVVLARFGEPAARHRDAQGDLHLRYPDQGLEVLVREEGRELFQYVHPAEFPRLLPAPGEDPEPPSGPPSP